MLLLDPCQMLNANFVVRASIAKRVLSVATVVRGREWFEGDDRESESSWGIRVQGLSIPKSVKWLQGRLGEFSDFRLEIEIGNL